ncbi:MAG: cupin [Spirochaetales bacterium]|nr:MAG: cupin [Spirochaetales bacterium]
MAELISAPSLVKAAGTKPKLIEEYIGVVNTESDEVSIARMRSPQGWTEPGQKPEFDEYTVVLKGSLLVKTKTNGYDVKAGQAFIARKGEWVQYSTPHEGAEYISVCLPAFSLEAVHRDS